MCETVSVDVETKEIAMSDPVHVVCVTDEDSGQEALYVSGDLRFTDMTVYACDIARETDGMTIQLSHIVVGLPGEEQYPQRLEDCMMWIRCN